MKKPKPPKRRNPVVQAMIARRQKAGRHKDKKKEASRKACRGRRLASGRSKLVRAPASAAQPQTI